MITQSYTLKDLFALNCCFHGRPKH